MDDDDLAGDLMNLHRNPLTMLLSPNETAVLTDLYLSGGAPVAAKEIALRFKMSPNTVGNVLQVLQAHGLADRQGRYSWVISSAGRKHFLAVDNTAENDGAVDNSAVGRLFQSAGITLRVIPDHSESDPPYDHDDDHMEIERIVEKLKDWGFHDAKEFAATYPTLAGEWVEWAENLPEDAISNFKRGRRGVGGTIRNGCRRGDKPPQMAYAGASGHTCPDCGREVKTPGLCLVCQGVVRN